MTVDVKKCPRGSFTIEATIVFTVVFIAVIVLIYIASILYRQTYIQTIADRAAQRGAEVWSTPEKDMFLSQITTESMGDPSLYWRIIDGEVETKKSKITKFSEYLLKGDAIFGQAEDLKAEAYICSDYIIYKKLRVKVTAKYKTPCGGLLKIVGVDDHITLTAVSEAVIDEPSEFIRNTDFVIDLVSEVDKGNKIGGTIDSLKRTVTGFISKINDFIDK